LLEFGIAIRTSKSKFYEDLHAALEDAENELTTRMRHEVQRAMDELHHITTRIHHYDREIDVIRKNNDACKRISEIPGIGRLRSTIAITELSDPSVYKNGRQFAA